MRIAFIGLTFGLFGCGDDGSDAGSIAVHLNHEVDGVALELNSGTMSSSCTTFTTLMTKTTNDSVP